MHLKHTLGGLVLLLMLAALVVAPSASAYPSEMLAAGQQFESTKGWYYTQNVCAGTEAAIADQPLQSYASNFTQLVVKGVCWGFWKNTDTGKLAVKWVLQRLQNDGFGYDKCRARAWDYNNTPTSFMDVSHQWKDGPPCGTGFYRTKSKAKVKDGGIWRKGSRATEIIFVIG